MEKLDLILQKIDLMDQKIDRIECKVDSLETRMDSLETRMDSLETRMDSLETRMDSLETRMDSLETRMDSLEHRVDALEETMKDGFSNLHLRMDQEVLFGLKAVADGHADLDRKFNLSLDENTTKEQMYIRMLHLHAEVQKIKRHCKHCA